MGWGLFWRGSGFNKHLVCSHFLATKVIVHDHSLQSRVVVCQSFVSSILEEKRYEICVVLIWCVQCIFSYGFWKTFRIKKTVVKILTKLFLSHRKSRELLMQVRICYRRELPSLNCPFPHFSLQHFELNTPANLVSVIKQSTQIRSNWATEMMRKCAISKIPFFIVSCLKDDSKLFHLSQFWTLFAFSANPALEFRRCRELITW